MGRKTRNDVLKEFVAMLKEVSADGRPRVSLCPSTRSWLYEGEPMGEKDLAHVLSFELDTSHDTMSSALRAVAVFETRDAWKRLQANVQAIEAMGVDEGPLRAFLRGMMHKSTTPEMMECHVWAFKQWIWQVKRNALRLPVTHHVMLVLYGAQGTGKTYNIDRLIAPFADFSATLSIDDLHDKFSKKRLARALIGNFQEFAGAEKADKQIVKAILTGAAFEGREMYGEGGFRAPNHLSCIASSNMQPPFGFEDESGGRRFWPAECTDVPKSRDPDAVQRMDELDWLGIWRAVSVSTESVARLVPPHVRDKMEAVREEQMRSHDALESFLEDDLAHVPHEDVEPIHFTVLQDLLKAYCARTGHRRPKKMTHAMMYRRFKAMGLKATRGGNRPQLHDHIVRPVGAEQVLPGKQSAA